MSVQRISSFKTFTEVKNQQASIKMHEENKAKREQLLAKIGQTLEEEGVTSFDELDEEKKGALVAKIFNEDRAEDIEAAKVKMGQPKKHEDEEGKALQATSEGNAFIYAAAKAKAEGKNEFEFDGKTYKVTLKSDTGLKESVMVITEGTRGFFGKIDKAGNIQAVYTHYDSYPENMLPTIKKSYKDGKNVDAVLAKGDNSGLLTDINKMNFYEDGNKPLAGKADKISQFIKDTTHSSAEFIYLYDERDKKWYMADTEKDKELKPAFESIELEGEDLNEARSINKIQGDWSKVTAEMAAKAQEWKAAESDAKAKILDELKALTAKKKALESELDAAVAGKDKDLELAVSESKESDEAADILDDLLGERDMDELHGMSMEDALDTVEAYGHSGSKAKKIAKELYSLCNESLEVNEDIDIFDKTADLMNKLQVQIGNLLHAAKGNKDWTKELEAIKAAFEKLEDRMSIASKKLGMIPESMEINEEDVKSDEEFKEYAFSVLKKAFGEDFDEAKAQEVVDGILAKTDGNYGDAVGMLTSSLGESVTNEATVEVDAVDPKDKGLAKLLKKHKVTLEVINKEGPSGFPEVRLTGSYKDLKAVLADSEYGWDDEDLADYIEESNTEN